MGWVLIRTSRLFYLTEADYKMLIDKICIARRVSCNLLLILVGGSSEYQPPSPPQLVGDFSLSFTPGS